MATMLVGDTMEMRVVCYLQSQISVNVVHYVVTTQNGTPQTVQAGADKFNTLVAAPMKALMCSQAKYRGTGLRRIRPIPVGIEYVNTSSDGIGGVAGNPQPKQVAGLLTKTSEFSGRHGRGRLYIPFPAVTDNDTDGTPITSYGTRALTLATALLGPVTVGVGPNDTILLPVLYDRVTHASLAMYSYLFRDRWATQRRRGDYGRTNALPW